MKTKMIRCIAAFSLMAVFGTGNVKAQELYKGELGLRYLPSFNSLSVNGYNGDVITGKVSMSHGIGVMMAHNFSKFAGLQLEVNYDKISQKYQDRGLDRRVDLKYLNIPLLLTLNTDKTMPVFFGIMAGPQVGLNVGSEITGTTNNNGDTLHAALAVKQGDVGVAYGAGFGIALSREINIRLDLGFRGIYGFVDMRGKETGPNTYNVIVKGSRKSYGGYVGITLLF